MAGIIGIYGLVVSVLISDGLKQELPLYTGFIQLGAGLAVGLAGLAAGYDAVPKIHPLWLHILRCSLASPSVSLETRVSEALPNNQGYSSA
jgi:hypothetical protein